MNDKAVVGAWRDLLAKHAAAWCALERELERHDLGPSEFEVLDYMADRGQDDYRVQELADATHLSQSALSRLIARLERADLVCRSMCDFDRRGVFVRMTDQGRARLIAARPTHRAVLEAVFDR